MQSARVAEGEDALVIKEGGSRASCRLYDDILFGVRAEPRNQLR